MRFRDAKPSTFVVLSSEPTLSAVRAPRVAANDVVPDFELIIGATGENDLSHIVDCGVVGQTSEVARVVDQNHMVANRVAKDQIQLSRDRRVDGSSRRALPTVMGIQPEQSRFLHTVEDRTQPLGTVAVGQFDVGVARKQPTSPAVESRIELDRIDPIELAAGRQEHRAVVGACFDERVEAESSAVFLHRRLLVDVRRWQRPAPSFPSPKFTPLKRVEYRAVSHHAAQGCGPIDRPLKPGR